MDFAVVYLAWRFVHRISEFFHHWYIDGSHAFARRFAAAKMSLRPSLPVVVRAVARALIAVAFAIVYAVWLAIPVIIIIYAATNI